MNRYFDLSDKVALVTGARRGIGLAIARGLAESGARVIVAGRTVDGMEPVLAELGVGASALVCDVSNEASVQAAARQVTESNGRLDILVNNAGIDPHYAPMERTATAQWDEVLQTNLNGVFYCCRHLGGLMLPARSGSMINISSVAGHVALKRQVPGISAKILTDRLRLLESAHLVTREYARTIPPQVTYSLAARGKELTPVLNELNAIALRWRAEDERRKAA